MDEAQQQSPPPVTGRDVALILRRRGKIAGLTFVVVVAATLALTSRMKPWYEARASVLVNDPGRAAIPANLLELLNGGGGPALGTEIEMLRSRRMLSEVIRKGKLKTNPDDLSSRLRTEIGPSGQTLILGVRARTGEEAARIANLVSRIYIVNTRFERERMASEATLQLRKGLKKAQAEKAAAQVALNAFKRQLGTADPGTLFARRSSQTVETQVALDNARSGLEVEQKRRAKRIAQLRSLSPTVVSGFSQNKNPVIDSYQNDLYTLERRRKALLLDYTEASEEVQQVDADMEAARAGIKEALKDRYSVGSKSVARNPDYSAAVSDVIGSDVAITANEASIRANESLLQELKQGERLRSRQQTHYENLLRRRDSAVANYEQLRQGITKVDINNTTAQTTARILDKAIVPNTPISPKPLLNGLMAVFLGGFLAICAALLSEYLSSTREDDARYGLPQVGGVPLLGSVAVALPPPPGAELPVPARAGSAVDEDALREVGYGLAHLRHDPRAPAPVVLIVPTRTDESGAALAAQLTATLVRDGLRVTLVDADRASPRLNRIFGAPDAPGLADVLGGRVKVTDILHVGADGNLRFLAAGAAGDATPATEKGLRRLFQDLQADTDIVVVSGPSVFKIPALAPLQKAADGVVLVTPPDASPGHSVARARRLLTNGHQPNILGVVVSGPADDAPAAAGRDLSPEAT